MSLKFGAMFYEPQKQLRASLTNTAAVLRSSNAGYSINSCVRDLDPFQQAASESPILSHVSRTFQGRQLTTINALLVSGELATSSVTSGAFSGFRVRRRSMTVQFFRRSHARTVLIAKVRVRARARPQKRKRSSSQRKPAHANERPAPFST